MMPPDPQESFEPEAEEARDAARTAEFAAALEAFERGRPAVPAPEARTQVGPSPGQRVRGRVVSVSGDVVLLDIGGRSEGVAEAGSFRGPDGALTVEVGQELELFVVEAGEPVMLARVARRSGGRRERPSLDAVKQARESGMPVSGKVREVNSGGVTIDLDGVRGFCPMSQLDSVFVEDAKTFVGRVLEFLVTEVDESRARVVLSRRRLLQREQAERARQRVAALAPGQELEGTVMRIEPFGAFVDLGGIDGLVHVSELSHARVAHPREVCAVGDRLRVKVLKVEPAPDGRMRVALSARAAAPDPWVTAAQRFTPGARVPGVVVRLADFGAFVNLAPGVDGLVHVSQVSDRRITHVREALSPGQAVEAIVLAVEPERRRISLSLREAGETRVTDSRIVREAGPATPEVPPPAPAESGPTPMQLALRRALERRERGE